MVQNKWGWKRNRVLVTLFLVIILLASCFFTWWFVTGESERWHRKKYGIPAGVCLGNIEIGGYYPEEVRKLLVEESKKLVKWPCSASIDRQGVVTPEIWGQILDLEATVDLVKTAQAGEVVYPVMVMIYPDLRSEEIFALNRTLGLYYTIVGGSEDRLHNIKTGGKLLNYTLLMPGEIFSFVRTVGEPSTERGFREAPVIVGEEFVPGVGGGLCQISTTLYNAVLKANLEVMERYPHSQQINYVPAGMDAAVAYDYLDFKFRNSLKYPILVKVNVWGRRLQIGIYGPDR